LAVTMGALVALVAGAGPAQASAVQSQTNLVQPAPFPQNKQNEPTIAQNPTDATNLVAGANDEIDLPGCTTSGCPFVTNVGLSGVLGVVTNSELITVSRSTDGGTTWSDPVLATSRTNPVDFNDKINLWVDRSPSSPLKGTVYVSWTLFQGGPGRAEPIAFSRSTDGGRTFSPTQQLTPAHNNSSIGGRQGSAIRTAPNGDVYVF